MLPIPREEVHERVKDHLNLRYKDRRGEKFSRLVLEALVDELRIYRLRCEAERDSRRTGAAMSRRGRRGEQDRSGGGEAECCRSPRKDRRSPIRDRNNTPRHRLPTPGPAQISTPPGTPEHMMSGAFPPDTVLPPRSYTPEPEIEKRRRRSPPMGPVPKYEPKMGLTLGWGTHLMNCVRYVAEEKAKEKRSNERRGRRRKRYEAKEGRDKDLKFHGEEGGGDGVRPPPAGNLGSSSGNGNREEAPNAWSCPPAPHEPTPADHAYRQTPHSRSVEEMERDQSCQTHAWEPPTSTHEEDPPAYHHNTHSHSVEEREQEQSRSESLEANVGERGRADCEYISKPGSVRLSNKG
jgi:hypothetical protein